MKTITVMSFKGGAGKTTIAVNLATTAYRGGYKTVLVDTDPSRASTLSLSARIVPGPDIQPLSSGALYSNTTITARAGYDVRIIDTPAAPRADVVTAANCADLCVVVCRPTFLDIAALLASADMIKQLGRSGAVVLNQTQPSRGVAETSSVRRAREALALVGLPLIGVVSSRLVYQQSLAQGLGAEEAGSVIGEHEITRLWTKIRDTMVDLARPTVGHLTLVSH